MVVEVLVVDINMIQSRHVTKWDDVQEPESMEVDMSLSPMNY